jgi:hypothetical protein
MSDNPEDQTELPIGYAPLVQAYLNGDLDEFKRILIESDVVPMFLYVMKQEWNTEEERIEFDRRHAIQCVNCSQINKKLSGRYFALALDRHLEKIYGVNHIRWIRENNCAGLLSTSLNQPTKFILTKSYDEYNTIIIYAKIN